MAPNPRLGIALAFVCLAILGVMPILSNSRPAGFDGLTFSVWLNIWQLIAAIPLTIREALAGHRGLFGTHAAPERRRQTALIAIATGAMFGVSTYMYVVAAEKAGPVGIAIALQAYPLFAILWETIFLGKRKTALELTLTAVMIAALAYLTTNGTFRPADISWWSVFALGIPFIWSVAHVLLRQVLIVTPVTANQVTVSRLLISGAFLVAVAVAFGATGPLAAGLSDLAFQKAAALMGIVYYLELIFWFRAVRHIDVSLASSITVPAPAVTMLIAVVFLGETIPLHQVLAMAAIVAAMYGLLFAGKRARSAGQ
jgi:drug/metabolite transporter (DMT)-like permease